MRQLVRDARLGRLPPLPPEIRLPYHKSGFPKVLALDCNQWVALARVHHGKSVDEGSARALAKIRAAVADARLVVPLHFINAIEAMQCEAADRRGRLVRFMVELSGNWFFRPFFEIAGAEAKLAVHQVRPTTDAVPLVRPELVAYGTPAMFGANSPRVKSALTALEAVGLREMLERWLRSPEATIEQLIDALRSDARTAGRALENRGAARMQEARATDSGISTRERIRLELTNNWSGRPGNCVRTALRDAGLNIEEFRQWLTQDENLEHFWERIPSVHIPLMLEIESAKNRSRTVDDNDLRDLSFYETVLPYANIVVTEKYWAGCIQRAELDTLYETRVYRRLDALEASLAEEGCA